MSKPPFYDVQRYRDMCDLVGLGGVSLPRILAPDPWDEDRRTYRGDRVRGEFYLATIDLGTVTPMSADSPDDPQRFNNGLEEESARVGQQLFHATVYELMRYALTGWDEKSVVVACGTTLLTLPVGPKGQRIRQLTFPYLVRPKTRRCIRVSLPNDFASGTQTLCVIPKSTEQIV